MKITKSGHEPPWSEIRTLLLVFLIVNVGAAVASYLCVKFVVQPALDHLHISGNIEARVAEVSFTIAEQVEALLVSTNDLLKSR